MGCRFYPDEDQGASTSLGARQPLVFGTPQCVALAQTADFKQKRTPSHAMSEWGHMRTPADPNPRPAFRLLSDVPSPNVQLPPISGREPRVCARSGRRRYRIFTVPRWRPQLGAARCRWREPAASSAAEMRRRLAPVAPAARAGAGDRRKNGVLSVVRRIRGVEADSH